MKRIDIADWTISQALSMGAQAARVELSCIDMLNVQCDDAEVSTLQQNSSCALVMRLYVDGRYGTYSTNRLERSEILSLISSGIACTRLLTPDPDRSLPDPKRYYQASSLQQNRLEAIALGNYSEEGNDRFDPVAMALSVGAPILGADSRIINVSTQLGYRRGWQYLADTQGFRGLSLCSQSYAFTSVSLHDEGDSRPSDGWFDYAIDFKGLSPALDGLGRKALDAALWRLGSGAVPAGRYTIAVEPTCLMKLLSPLIDAMSDYSLYQKRSFLIDRLDSVITSPILTITEEPQHHGAYGACLFDFEGVRTSATDIIRNGRLCTYLFGTYYSRKMSVAPTLSGVNVLCIEPGTRSRQQILDSSPSDVILITGFLGGNSNEATGDFSFGIEAQLFRHGERIQGIAGMNITGNILSLWQNLAEVANDTEKVTDGYFPTLFFHDIELA
ncbi:MAG: TldD/PmbA family protein [Bacteroidales bacterium]|nr:TldD/PmbA family protein [Candidatus Liminaster caballi]